MAQALLPDSQHEEVERLRREIRGLEIELREAKDEAASAKQSASDAVQAIRALRDALLPVHKALKMVFGEISRIEVGESQVSQSNGVKSDAWEKWKRKVPGKPAEFIDAILEHGPMTVQQLVVATQTPRKQTIYDGMSKLSKMNLVEKQGDKYALRQL